jgi:hypothetical protein
VKTESRKGSALLVVIGIVLVISIATGALSYSASQQMHAAKVTREQLKARLIAESGLNKAYHAVRRDFSLAGNYADEADFGGGSFEVESLGVTQAEGNASVSRAQFVSHGVCGIGRAVVAMDLENRPVTAVDGSSGDDYFELLFDLLVGGTLDLKGNFKAHVTAIHANGNATITGSAETDAKQVSSAGSVEWKKPNGTVTLLPNQPSVQVFTAALNAAIDAFIAYARQNNAVYANGADIPNSPPGGVAYCTGNPDGWSRSGNGCFIFAGDASFQGRALDVTSVNGFPAIVVMGTGEVKMNSGSVVHGALLVPHGSVKLNGHAAFYGPILVGQGMTGNGTADLYAGEGQGFDLPPEETTTDNVVITAWH